MNKLAPLVLVLCMMPSQTMLSIKNTMLSAPHKVGEAWNNASFTERVITVSLAACVAGCMAKFLYSKVVCNSLHSDALALPHVRELPRESINQQDFAFDRTHDMPGIYQLLQAEWLKLYNAEYPGNDHPLVVNRFIKQIFAGSKLYIKVVKKNNEIAGFITYYKSGPTVGHIDLLAVAKKYRNQGLGQRLLEQAESHLRQDTSIQMIDILVLFSNLNAQNLYKKLHFVADGSVHQNTWICLKKFIK